MPGHLQLLGEVQGHFGGPPVPFPRDKRHLLLAYLAAEGGWVNRERLAFLFWPDSPDALAYQNLRRLLQRVRALPWLRGLEVGARQVRWAVPTDVAACEEARARGRVDQALGGYGGPFLASLEPIDPPEYRAWAEAERERLRRLWHGLTLDRARAWQREGRFGEVLALLGPLIAGDEFDDAALGEYLRAAYRGGRREEGLRASSRYAARLRADLGLEPAGDLRRIVRAMREDDHAFFEMGEPALPPPRPPDPPAWATSFVGRGAEVAEVSRLLRGREHPLVTLVGPGGVGKTRLAAQVWREAAPLFPGGAAFVPLEDVRGEAELVAAVARGLPVRLPQPSPGGVVRFLAPRDFLLVLDNLEHLPEAAPLVRALLEGCPGVRVLATSRAPLGLLAETRVTLEGLPFPPGAAGWDDGAGGVRLFVERARQVDPRFEVAPPDRPHLLRLGRSVGGLPLALELAATWVRLLSLEEIADAVTGGPDLLRGDLEDLPPRQRSVRAVLDRTWELLGDSEREALRHLGSVDAPFEVRAVEAITGVTPDTLRRLQSRGLIRRQDPAHLGLHPLVRGLAAGRAAAFPGEVAEVRRRHAEYYARFLADRPRPRDGGPEQVRALNEIEANLENVRSAWRWLLGHRAADLLDPCLDPLWQFYECRGRNEEGAETFGLAAGQEGWPRVTHGRLLTRLGICLLRLGRVDRAGHVLLRGLSRLRGSGHPDLLLAYLHLGVVAQEQGHPRRAMTVSEVGLREARRSGNRWAEDGFTTRLALGYQARGDLGRARALHERRLRANEALGDIFGVALCTMYLGGVSALEGRHAEAEDFFRRGAAAWQSLGRTEAVAHARRWLGDLASVQGKFRTARARYAECAAGYAELGCAEEAWRARLRSAHARLSLHDPAGARAELAAAREVWGDDPPEGLSLEWHTLLARLLRERGEYGEAAHLLREVAVPATPGNDVFARHLLRQLDAPGPGDDPPHTVGPRDQAPPPLP